MKAVKEELPEWKKAIFEKMKANHEKRFNALKEEYNSRLTDLIGIYFQTYSLDEEENKNNYVILNTEWKDLVQKVNTTRSIIKLKFDAFENAIEENIKHPDFQKAIEQMKADAEKAEVENAVNTEANEPASES